MVLESCPDQKDLENTLAFKPDLAAGEALHAQFRRLGGSEGVDPLFNKENLDIIAGPADSALVCFAAAAGYPVACLPMSVLKDSGRPFGICVMAKTGGEKILLDFMKKWEKLFPHCEIPKPLSNWQSI